MKHLLFTLLLILSVTPLQAKDLTLVAGLSLPPYIIQDDNSGMEFEIIKESLKAKGHNVKLKYVPFVRLVVDYKNHDGAITINESSGITGNYSDPVITYKNYAISLKKNGITVNSIGDLKDKKVVAFQNATTYLGPEFAAVAKGNSSYSEQGQQVLQVKVLYSGRTDLIVSDINIFKYYRKQVKDIDTSPEVTLHEIFPGVDYKVLFNDAAIRDDFNTGLKMIRDSGRYDEIIKAYVQ